MREFGVGIVGYGFIGKVHAFAHRAIPLMYDAPFRARLVGVCTASPATAARAAEQAGFAFATTDPGELLARDDIDVIHVCTPNDAHTPLLLAALAAGKHVYCDKPLTATLAEAEAVLQSARGAAAAGSVRRMTFNYRFAPATLRAKQLVAEGFLGEIYQFRGQYLHAGYIDPKRPYSWRVSMARSGGGAIMDLGVHIFDLVRWLVGDFAAVNAQLATFVPERPDSRTGVLRPVDVDDVAVVQVRTAGGAVGVIEASRLATGAQDGLRFEIHGSRGAIAFDLMDPNWLSIYDATVPEGPLGGNRGPQRIECVSRYPKPYAFATAKSPIGWSQLHVHGLHDFLTAIATAEQGDGATFEDGLAANRFVDACQRSAASGGWVTLGDGYGSSANLPTIA